MLRAPFQGSKGSRRGCAAEAAEFLRLPETTATHSRRCLSLALPERILPQPETAARCAFLLSTGAAAMASLSLQDSRIVRLAGWWAESSCPEACRMHRRQGTLAKGTSILTVWPGTAERLWLLLCWVSWDSASYHSPGCDLWSQMSTGQPHLVASPGENSCLYQHQHAHTHTHTHGSHYNPSTVSNVTRRTRAVVSNVLTV